MNVTTCRRITAALSAAATIAILAGCGTSSGSGSAGSAKVGDLSTKPAACTVDSNPDDSVIPVREVTDEFGTYCATGLDPESDVATADRTKYDQSLRDFGVSTDVADAAYNRTIELVANTIIDSEILDTPDIDGVGWFESNMEDQVSPGFRSKVDSGELASTALVIAEYTPRPINRTGDARAYETVITSDMVHAGQNDGEEPMMVVTVSAISKYHTTDAALVEATLRNGVAADVTALEAAQPTLFDGIDDDDLVITYAVTFGYTLSNPDILDRTKGTLTYITGRGFDISYAK